MELERDAEGGGEIEKPNDEGRDGDGESEMEMA